MSVPIGNMISVVTAGVRITQWWKRRRERAARARLWRSIAIISIIIIFLGCASIGIAVLVRAQ